MCSYCGCESIEVIGRFMAEHEQIINATGDLRRAVAAGDPDAVDVTRAAVARLLWPHTTAEEVGRIVDVARPWRTAFPNHDRLTPESGYSSRVGVAETLAIGGRSGLVPIVTHMKAQGREDFLIIFAGDDQGRTGYREEVEGAIAAAGLSGDVSLVGHCDDMPAAYLAATVVVVAATVLMPGPRWLAVTR